MWPILRKQALTWDYITCGRVLLGKLSFSTRVTERKGRIAIIKYCLGVVYCTHTMTFYFVGLCSIIKNMKIHYRILLHHYVGQKATTIKDLLIFSICQFCLFEYQNCAFAICYAWMHLKYMMFVRAVDVSHLKFSNRWG